MQLPVHAAVSQHTPSTHWPEAQDVAVALVQPSPLARLATEYSQVSLAVPPGEPLMFPPKTTATRLALSKTMPARKRPPGVTSRTRVYQASALASSSQVCWMPLAPASVKKT